jgi:hypothetical protein
MQRYGGSAVKIEPKPQLVAVQIVDDGQRRTEVAVVLQNGLRIEVGRGFDTRTLQQVVTALEG